MVEGIQYVGDISSIRWKIFCTDVSCHEHGRGASQYTGGHAECRILCFRLSTKKCLIHCMHENMEIARFFAEL